MGGRLCPPYRDVPTNFKTIPQGLRMGLVPNALNDAAAANSLNERANFPIKNLNRPVGAHGLKVPKALLFLTSESG